MSPLKICSFEKKPAMELLVKIDCTHGTHESVRWPCEPIVFLIGHFQGPTEVQLNSW